MQVQQSQGALPFNTNFLANELALKVKNKRSEGDANMDAAYSLFTFPALRCLHVGVVVAVEKQSRERQRSARFAY